MRVTERSTVCVYSPTWARKCIETAVCLVACCLLSLSFSLSFCNPVFWRPRVYLAQHKCSSERPVSASSNNVWTFVHYGILASFIPRHKLVRPSQRAGGRLTCAVRIYVSAVMLQTTLSLLRNQPYLYYDTTALYCTVVCCIPVFSYCCTI